MADSGAGLAQALSAYEAEWGPGDQEDRAAEPLRTSSNLIVDTVERDDSSGRSPIEHHPPERPRQIFEGYKRTPD